MKGWVNIFDHDYYIRDIYVQFKSIFFYPPLRFQSYFKPTTHESFPKAMEIESIDEKAELSQFEQQIAELLKREKKARQEHDHVTSAEVLQSVVISASFSNVPQGEIGARDERVRAPQ